MDPAERYQRLTQIFLAVCSLEGAQRRSELDRLCQGQEELRSEIELLLTFHDSVTRPPQRPKSIREKPER
jgi:hypothetical protein